MFWWFSGKKEVERVREDVKESFELVKKDMNDLGEWIKHLNSHKEMHKKDIESIRDILSSIKKDVDEIKNSFESQESTETPVVFKTPKRVFKKQTAVYAVQTAVQTPKLEHFSITERAILWILLNTDMKLSYEDIASILGKERSTIRGQINTIKQKSEGLIMETSEKNNKKRVFIHENMKEKLLKKAKVRVKKRK